MKDDRQEPLLRVSGLRTRFRLRGDARPGSGGFIHAVDGVDLSIDAGRTLALIGESGSGKTTAGLSMLRLVKAWAGEVWFEGVDLLSLSPRAFRPYRRSLQVVFQDTLMSLDPGLSVRDAIAEGLNAFGIGANASERTDRVAGLMTRVRLDPSLMARFPSELSGGQRQRVGIARALAVEPRLIVCDEALSALDVSIQVEILDLLRELQESHGLAYLFITHDLSVARRIAHRVAVMYLGRIVEEGEAGRVLKEPSHPYTQALLAAVPSADPARRSAKVLTEGEPSSASRPPTGCRFHPRCPQAFERCGQEEPALYRALEGGSRCFLAEPTNGRAASRAGPVSASPITLGGFDPGA